MHQPYTIEIATTLKDQMKIIVVASLSKRSIEVIIRRMRVYWEETAGGGR